MMAAGRAGELGAKVVLLEKNRKLGRKLLLTGNGRCNLTQAEFDLPELVARYGKSGKFLFPAFHLFGPRQVMEFFESRGLPLKIESGGKVFPKSDHAGDVLAVLENYLRQGKVEIRYGAPVTLIGHEAGEIKYVWAADQRIEGRSFILATGGRSYPETGSQGNGYRWLKELGHKVVEPRPALTPLKVKEKWAASLQGLSLEKVGASLEQAGKKKCETIGPVLFTHFGMSGPAILDLSKLAGELRDRGEVKLVLDFKPELSAQAIEERLLAILSASPNQMLKNALSGLVAARLAEALTRLARIAPEKKAHAVSRQERKVLAGLVKRTELTVSSLPGFDKAMVTTGGCELSEIDPNTMRSRIIRNLFLAGELLNLDGPSGGYNLQLCWSTGRLAGINSIE